MWLAAAIAHAGSLAWDPAVDIPLTVAAGGTSLLLVTQVEPGLAPQAQAVPHTGLDSLAPTEVRPGIDLASDYVVAGVAAVSFGLATLEGVRRKDAPVARAVVWAEAFAVNALVTETLKVAVRRPRPYTGGVALTVLDDDLSFPSGHTSYTAAATFAAARTIELSGGRPAECVAAYASATAITATVATMRVAAGKHYPSDVLAGAFLGAAAGFVVPSAHRVRVSASPGGVAVAGAW
jgi:membrane-associated phospholipid phosphatase